MKTLNPPVGEVKTGEANPDQEEEEPGRGAAVALVCHTTADGRQQV